MSSPKGCLDRVLPSLQAAAPRIPHFLPAPVPSSYRHLACVPRHCGHPLPFIPASRLILPEFCRPSSASAWQPPAFQLPGNLMAARPDLAPRTASGLKVRERGAPAGTDEQPRAESQGPKPGYMCPPHVGLVPTLPPSSTDLTPSLVKASCFRLDAPPGSPNLTFHLPKPSGPPRAQLGTLTIRGRCRLFSRVLIQLEH